jgi:hypothetical protein
VLLFIRNCRCGTARLAAVAERFLNQAPWGHRYNPLIPLE